MKTVLIRNLSDDVYRAICLRAAAHGRSVEAEIRAILTAAVRPDAQIEPGSRVVEFGG
ncbi:FitA-like ribbon-helix-helix domain-containing protein [Nocardia bovistercoris]|uniref:Antitoxin FitA-like ribbon-helix-helix domain-containing protein n=1 Tax=Nocardia bovistercoris TaxID=2785916 RepID=A0A931IF89_9NOCA|nr:plasmid stability protein [Nocardia bovistercoris]MBH0780627.1 hypothetical protein [Nocardia bovistercoris]